MGLVLIGGLGADAPFLFVDLTFLTANLLKVVEGGWMPLALGAVVMTGHVHLAARQPLAVREDAAAGNPARRPGRQPGKEAAARVPGTAVFLTSDPEFAPTALLHSLKHYKVLHEQNVILTIETARHAAVVPPSGCRSSRSARRSRA